MCIDYCTLNNVMIKNGYPLPHIQECLNRVSPAKYKSKLDLTSEYYQVQVTEADIQKTAFNTHYGKYEF